MTYKIGTIGEFARWTQRVVADPAAASVTPKSWFDSEETAEKALGTRTTPEAMVKLLSNENLVLLHLSSLIVRSRTYRGRSGSSTRQASLTLKEAPARRARPVLWQVALRLIHVADERDDGTSRSSATCNSISKGPIAASRSSARKTVTLPAAPAVKATSSRRVVGQRCWG
jgi:hypothetical protein